MSANARVLTDSSMQISELYEVHDELLRREIRLAGSPIANSMRARVPGESGWDSWWLTFLRGGSSTFTSGRATALKSVDLFASIGGLTLGVSQAAQALGFKINPELAADLDADALATYSANFKPAMTTNRSVRSLVDFQVLGQSETAELTYTPKLLEDAVNISAGVDLIMGGPPCQGHSSLNNHTRGKDVRNDLYLTLPALAIGLNAKTVIIENVPRVVLDYGKVVNSSIKVLEDAGYWVTQGVLSANDFGWAQTRSRHFLIASRIKRPLAIDDAIRALGQSARPLSWAIADLEEAFDEKSLFNSVPTLSAENQTRINWLFDNDAYELPNHVRPLCHQDGHTYPSVYGRLKYEKPSPTITTGYQSPGRGRYIHPTQRRVLTSHEAARIQGFPDSFIFETAKGQPLQRTNLQKWIGDAVPSILGYVAGLVALETLI